MIIFAALFIASVILSAFFSGSEMAFISANKLKIRELADDGDEKAKKIMRLQDHPQNFLTSVLIGNNIVNVIATTALTIFLEKYFAIQNEWLVTLIMAPILVILGETVPKEYGRVYAQKFLFSVSSLLILMERVFRLPVEIILKGVDAFLKPLGADMPKSIFVSDEEFRLMIEEGARVGVLAKHEKQLIDTILDFERIHVASVMVPLADLPKINIASGTIKQIKEIARQTKSRMVLVYEEIPSIVVGMIYIYDLLFEENEKQGLKKFLRSPVFLAQTTSIEKAFLTLQDKRQSYAVVMDASGEVTGAVPIERLLVSK